MASTTAKNRAGGKVVDLLVVSLHERNGGGCGREAGDRRLPRHTRRATRRWRWHSAVLVVLSANSSAVFLTASFFLTASSLHATACFLTAAVFHLGSFSEDTRGRDGEREQQHRRLPELHVVVLVEVIDWLVGGKATCGGRGSFGNEEREDRKREATWAREQ